MRARSEQSAQRFYSMSAQIRYERKAYYDILEATRKGNLDITDWLGWFLDCLGRAIESAETTLAAVLIRPVFGTNFGNGLQRSATLDRQSASQRL